MSLQRNLMLTCGAALVAGGVLLALGWFAIPVVAWDAITSEDYIRMVLNPYWVAINTAILLAQFLLLIGVVGLYLAQASETGRWGLVGFVSLLVGMAAYASIQFFETYLWPVIARDAPVLFATVGIPMEDPVLRAVFLLSGLPWGIGFLLLGITTMRSAALPRWAGIAFLVGGLLFGLGIAIPLRSLGVLVLGASVVRLGFSLWQAGWQEAQ